MIKNNTCNYSQTWEQRPADGSLKTDVSLQMTFRGWFVLRDYYMFLQQCPLNTGWPLFRGGFYHRFDCIRKKKKKAILSSWKGTISHEKPPKNRLNERNCCVHDIDSTCSKKHLPHKSLLYSNWLFCVVSKSEIYHCIKKKIMDENIHGSYSILQLT